MYTVPSVASSHHLAISSWRIMIVYSLQMLLCIIATGITVVALQYYDHICENAEHCAATLLLQGKWNKPWVGTSLGLYLNTDMHTIIDQVSNMYLHVSRVSKLRRSSNVLWKHMFNTHYGLGRNLRQEDKGGLKTRQHKCLHQQLKMLKWKEKDM